MELKYKRDMEDIVAFVRYHFRHSPAARRLLRRQWALFTLLTLVVVFLSNDNLPLMFRVMFALFGAGVIALLFPWLYLRGAERQTIRLYFEGPATGIFGDFSLALEQQGLRGSSEAGEQLVYWRAIYRISQTPDHAFIYLNPAVAIIIPRAKILSGPFEQFMHEIQSRAPQSNA